MKELFLILIIAIIIAIIYWRIRKNFKPLNVPSFCLITGGVKTGKTKLGTCLAQNDFKKVHRAWSISNFFCKVLHLKNKTEEPLYYTNGQESFGDINAKQPHKLDRCIMQLDLDTLLRLERYNYKSIIHIQEGSLMADNMDYNNIEKNVDLSLWCKLIAHMTRGGKVYIDTQSILDLHYSFKRVCSTYLFIQKRVDFFFFDLLYVREMINGENGNNNFNEDVDFTTRKVIVPRWWNHRYNRYEYSYFTDSLPIHNRNFIARNGLTSFNPLYRDKADKRPKENKE